MIWQESTFIHLPKGKSGPVATVKEVVLLLGHDDLLALHGGHLGRIRSDAGRGRRNRGRATGLTETSTGVVHGTLNGIDLRLEHLWWLRRLVVQRRGGRNRLVLIHRRMRMRMVVVRMVVHGRRLGRNGCSSYRRVWGRWGKMVLGWWRRRSVL